MNNILSFWSVDEKKIRVLIHIDSFRESSPNEIIKLNWLIEYSNLEFIQFKFCPSINIELVNEYNRHKLEIPAYCVLNNRLHLKIRDEENHPGPIINYKYIEETLIRDCKIITNYDIVYLNHLEDYFFVISEIEYKRIKNRSDNRFVTVDKIFYYLNLLFLNMDTIYLNPYTSVSQFLYYLYKRKKVFASFQPIFSRAIFSKEKELDRCLYSLDGRLHFILKAIDILEGYHIKEPNLDNHDDFLYHFAYLNILLTGALDDLAQLYTKFYNLSIKKMRITLRVYQSKCHSDFTKKVSEYNKEFAKYIEKIEVKRIINLIYVIRDKIQHQELPRNENSNSYKVGIDFSNDSENFDINYYINAKLLDNDISRNCYYINPEVYTNLIKEEYYTLINKILEFIDLDYFWDKIPKKYQEKIINEEKNNGMSGKWDWARNVYLLDYSYS